MKLQRNVQRVTILTMMVSSMVMACPNHDCTDAGGEIVQNKEDSRNPWIRPAQKGKNTAAYLPSVTAILDDSDELLTVTTSSNIANVIELHDHIDDNGIMRMRPVASIPVEKDKIIMQPGGKHIMLLGLTQDLKSGDKILFELRFKNYGVKQVEFIVQ